MYYNLRIFYNLVLLNKNFVCYSNNNYTPFLKYNQLKHNILHIQQSLSIQFNQLFIPNPICSYYDKKNNYIKSSWHVTIIITDFYLYLKKQLKIIILLSGQVSKI